MSKEKKPMRSFGGYGEESEFFNWDHETFINRMKGEVLVGIGAGEYNYALRQALNFAYARGARDQCDRMLKEQETNRKVS